MIAFGCKGCGLAFEVDAALAGRKARCPKCGRVTRVPAAEPVFELAPEPVLAPAEAVRRRRRFVRPKRKIKEQPKWAGVERDGWVALAIGFPLAGVAMALWPIGFALHVLTTIIHESGHTAAAWLLASPAFPQFDLVYGGGYSHVFNRQPVLIVVAYAALAYLLFQARNDRCALIALAVAATAYTLVMFTPLRGVAINAMGHGDELIFAGLFLYRALSGSQVLSPAERPLYAMLGCFLVLSDLRLAVKLMTDDAFRVLYGDAKGGGHWMDFDRIATAFGWPLPRVAGVFLLACVLTPGAAYLIHRHFDRKAREAGTPDH